MPSSHGGRVRRRSRPGLDSLGGFHLEGRELLSAVIAPEEPPSAGVADLAPEGFGTADPVDDAGEGASAARVGIHAASRKRPAGKAPRRKAPGPRRPRRPRPKPPSPPNAAGRVVSLAHADLYIPANLPAGRPAPVVVVFHAAGNAADAIDTWRAQANRRGWIVYASKEFSNAAIAPPGPFGIDGRPSYDAILAKNYRDERLLARIKGHIDEAIVAHSADASRVILAGFSGGAYVAHDLNASNPGFAAAVIDNSNGEPLIGQIDSRFADGVPTPESFAKSRRNAIFLVGRDDATFRPQVEKTIPVYAAWGWSVLSRTYPAGHAPAPAAVLDEALDWLVARPSWA